MAPPLDRKDLYRRPRLTCLRLPRRTRRATYLCWALLIAAFYFIVNSATQWSTPEFLSPKVVIPIRFPSLYSTLSQVVGGGIGPNSRNRNVIFVAANLTAASKLAGIACDMARYPGSNVHLALMGFDTLEVADFKRINGLALDAKSEGCNVFLHDARPGNGGQLPLEKRKIAVMSAFRHINEFMHPKAILMYPLFEDQWFMELARKKAKQMDTALVELGKHAVNDLRWVTRLDSGSLNAWNNPTFEIVIHADKHSGSLERLLKSIQSAYYPSPEHRPTRITVVLDPFESTHPLTKDFLLNYKFQGKHKLTIRRPLLSKDPQAVARNFVESFYTLNNDHSVLFLDPNTELSKWYYHYLLYATLKYRYSYFQDLTANSLYGISLEAPPRSISGDTPFPTADPNNAIFLYPAPTSRAALFFPEHWLELHSYISHQLLPPPNPGTRNASRTAPELTLLADLATSWKALFLELVRARGYVMLYPNFPDTLAVVHNEIPSSHASRKAAATSEKRLMERSFLELLPGRGLPVLDKIPLRDLWGQTVEAEAFMAAAKEYRLSITTCPENTPVREYSVGDLFCDADGKSL